MLQSSLTDCICPYFSNGVSLNEYCLNLFIHEWLLTLSACVCLCYQWAPSMTGPAGAESISDGQVQPELQLHVAARLPWLPDAVDC